MPPISEVPNSESVAITSSLPSVDDWRDPVVRPRSSPVLERLFRRRTGLVPAVVPYLAPHPWAYRPFLFLMNPTFQALDERLSSQICFVVARDNACRFCYGRFRSFLRVAGYSAAELNRLENELHLRGASRADEVALRFAVELSQGRLDRGTTLADLREVGYGPTAIREIGGVAATATLINRMATMLSIPINEDVETLTQEWFFAFVRPFVRALLKGWQSVGAPATSPLGEPDGTGPFTSWTGRLQTTRVGAILDDVLQQWSRGEGALSLRLRLFLLAVVARGLHCDALEARATDLLRERCGESADRIAAVVDHLRGDIVTDRETALLELARDSIRYEAGRIQARVLDCTQDLSRAETIDAVATLGLSNALARLRALAPLDE